jgi:replication factor C subunit 2/4
LYGPKRVHQKVLELNASDENGISVVRDKIIKFAKLSVGTLDPKYPSPSYKIIILDEADSMTSEAQTALKKVMETTCDITRFVFICNYENQIIDPIKSRCASFRFNKISDNLIIKKLKKITKDEKLNIQNSVYKIITNICDGDARRSINTLQNLKYIPNKKITDEIIYSITSYVNDKDFKDLWNICLKSDISTIVKTAKNIVNTGYPINYILEFISNKAFDSDLDDINKSKIINYISITERKIVSGADNYLQLLSILTFINLTHKKINHINTDIY